MLGRSHRPFVIVICFLSLFVTGLAQTDPEGLSHAWGLNETVERQDKEAFRTLFSSDRDLSRRGYLAALEYGLVKLFEGDDQEGQKGFVAATAIAIGLEREYGESEPQRILKAFSAEDSKAIEYFFHYSDKHFPGYRKNLVAVVDWLAPGGQPSTEPDDSPSTVSATPYGKPLLDSSQVSDDDFKLIRPYLVKLQRIAFAETFDDSNLVIQELDSYKVVEDELFRKAQAAGALERVRRDFAFVKPQIQGARLRVLAEVGLLQEFESEIRPLLLQEGDVNEKLQLLYTGYRVALRQQQWPEAERYLQKMNSLLRSEPDTASRVYRFVAETAAYQLRLAQGATSSDAEVLAEFDRCWSTLEGYRPIVSVTDDVSWHLTRVSARFWIDQLNQLTAEQNVHAILRITEDCSKWIGGIDAFVPELDSYDNKEALFHSEQLQGYLTVALANLDIMIYIIETWKPMLEDRDNFAGVADSFPKSIEGISKSAEEMNPTLEGPGFPEFRLGESFLLKELTARSRYLLALDPGNSPTQRISKLEDSARIFDTVELPESYIDYHLVIGEKFQQWGRPDLAIEAWQKAYSLAQERGFVRRAIDASALLAKEFGQAGDWDNAQLFASRASHAIEGELDSSDSQLVALNDGVAVVNARAAIESDQPEQALAALVQNEQVKTAAVRLKSNKEAAQANRQLNSKKTQMAALSQEVKKLQSLPDSSTRDELLQKTEQLLAQSKSEFLLQSRNIRQKFSKLYTTALRFDPLNLPDIQKVLPPKTAVVQYFPTDEALYVFVVTSDKFRLRSVGQKKSELDDLVGNYLVRLRRAMANDRKLEEASQGLYRVLVSPIEEDLRESDTIVFIPTGQLNLLPFASLQNSQGQYLLESKILLELAKPTDFLKIALSQPKPIGKVITFANATQDLPAAEEEGETITALFPNSRLFKRQEASKANLVKFGSQAEVLHLATHGTWDAQDSLKNHLKLSNDEKLDQEEIFNLALENTSLVTLSACSTALGENKDIEYVASLAEAFWIAGSRTVIASLWQVSDDSTSLLMTQFYRELKNGKPKGAALRDAQLLVRKDPRFAHPYYWSGFLLFGDYR
jgi:CHAT domain-containing protein